MKNLLFIILLIFNQSIHAQTPMLAYRIEGIWHYFDTEGKLMWKPFADVAAMPQGWKNGYLSASEMVINAKNTNDINVSRRQVLYNNKGKVMIVPKVKGSYRIKTGIDQVGIFVVEVQNNESTDLVLCNKLGVAIYKNDIDRIQYLGGGIVAYHNDVNEENSEKDKIFKLYNVLTKKEIAKIKCYGFKGNFEDGAVFCHNAEFKYGMLNKMGKLLQPLIWEDTESNYDNTENPLIGLSNEYPLQKKFVVLKEANNTNYSVINNLGEVVIEDVIMPKLLNTHFISVEQRIENTTQLQTYIVTGTKVKKFNGDEYNSVNSGTLGGMFAVSQNDITTLYNKTLQKLATVKCKNYESIIVLKNHIWIPTNEGEADCYNEKGQKTGHIKYNTVDVAAAANGHIFFEIDNLWGLAKEDGTIIMKPQFNFDGIEVPTLHKDFFEINKKLNADENEFSYYNYNGKLIKKTTAKKDGWDFLLVQEQVANYYKYY
jgi:hypothetical protein